MSVEFTLGSTLIGGSDGKASAYNVGDSGSIPGQGAKTPPCFLPRNHNINNRSNTVTNSIDFLKKALVIFLKNYFQVWRRPWCPTPVLLPGKFHGQMSLVGYSPWVAKSRTRLNDFIHFYSHWIILSNILFSTYFLHQNVLGRPAFNFSEVASWNERTKKESLT